MEMMLRTFFALILTAYAMAQPAATPYQESLTQGVQAYKSARYADAVAAFERAVNLEPNSVQAHLYLATAYMTQWIPGARSSENDQLATRARGEFERVLSLDPNNSVAIASLASIAYNESAAAEPAEKAKKLEDAARFNQRLIDVDPRNKEAHYSLGVIAWSRFYPAYAMVRSRLGMRPEDPGPLPDLNARQELRSGYEAIVNDGIRHLETAIAIDPQYDDAMAYLNLLIRERADWKDTAAEYKHDVELADAWVHKAIETKKMKAQNAYAGPHPPPPPPGPGSTRLEVRAQSEQSQPAQAPRQIQVGADVQAAQLVNRVEPVYPPLARQAQVEGVVRFSATIDKQGRIAHLQLVGGHPLLVPAAAEAVKQWVYRPTVLNGEAVEVKTTIEVPFSPNR